ncbi:MAG TPA: tetratricopeptide repeat protein [Methylocystis sp.]
MHKVSPRMLLAAAAISAVCGPVSAASNEDPAIISRQDGGENYIEIPGVGRIPMPPGAKVFQPRGAQRFSGDDDETAVAPKPAPPPAPKSPEQARAAALEDLLARLKNAADEPEALAIGAKVRGLFANAPSETVALLADRAMAAVLGGAQPVAQALLDHVIALDPRWSEGFVRRARAKATRGDGAGAREDLEAALRLEPRRFDALASLGALFEEAGDKKGALDAYRRALALDPKQEALQKIEDRLRLDVEGRDI